MLELTVMPDVWLTSAEEAAADAGVWKLSIGNKDEVEAELVLVAVPEPCARFLRIEGRVVEGVVSSSLEYQFSSANLSSSSSSFALAWKKNGKNLLKEIFYQNLHSLDSKF